MWSKDNLCGLESDFNACYYGHLYEALDRYLTVCMFNWLLKLYSNDIDNVYDFIVA